MPVKRYSTDSSYVFPIPRNELKEIEPSERNIDNSNITIAATPVKAIR